MIDKRPTPGDMTQWVMEPYDRHVPDICPTLHEEVPARRSSVLGPDGEPLMVGVPRPVIGFDLRPRRKGN